MLQSKNPGNPSSKNPCSKVLVIVTGGTICMTKGGVGASLRPCSLYERLTKELGASLENGSLPYFDLEEWDTLIDSSNMSLTHWTKLAEQLEKNYDIYDGFVVLHGTDSMAYTASSLSFMLENLSKPVILTGSMLPIHHIQTDARGNFAVALLVAAYSGIPEVCILFGSRLLRGNRASKVDCSRMDAFKSPNFPPLGTVGVDITIDKQLLMSPKQGTPFCIFTGLCLNIVVLTIVPGFQLDLFKHLLLSSTRPLGVILNLYGTGTAPSTDGAFLNILKLGIEAGVAIVAISQCASGSCSLVTYESGALLYYMGVIEGKDMTVESAFAKLAYLMGKGYVGAELKSLMESDIRGELTESPLRITGQASLGRPPTLPGVEMPKILSPRQKTRPESFAPAPECRNEVGNALGHAAVSKPLGGGVVAPRYLSMDEQVVSTVGSISETGGFVVSSATKCDFAQRASCEGLFAEETTALLVKQAKCPHRHVIPSKVAENQLPS